MGADMLGISLYWLAGEDDTEASNNAKDLLETAAYRLENSTLEDLKDFTLLCWHTSNFARYSDEELEQALCNMKFSLKDSLAMVKSAVSAPHQQAHIEVVGEYKVLFAGGMSWGDSPGDLYDAIYDTVMAGLFDPDHQQSWEAQKSLDYVKDSGKCPFCGSLSISGDSLDISGGTVCRELFCSNCYSEWRNLYKLQGLADLNICGETQVMADSTNEVPDREFSLEAAEGLPLGVRFIGNAGGKDVRKFISRRDAMERADAINTIAKARPDLREKLLGQVKMIINACNESRKLDGLPEYTSPFVKTLLKVKK